MFSWFAGYFAVSGATTTFTAHVYCRGNLWSTPAPTIAGLFWPVALPMLGAIAFTTAVVHSHQARVSARAESEREMRERLDDLEQEMCSGQKSEGKATP